MRNRIGNTSSYYSTQTPSESSARPSRSGSERSFQTSSSLSGIASHLSAAGEGRSGISSASTVRSYYAPAPSTNASGYGSALSSIYESASGGSQSHARSDTGSSASSLLEIDIGGYGSSNYYEIDLDRTGGASVAGSRRPSDVASSLSEAGTPSGRSFHLSERGSVASALRDGRLGYSSASSRRLTSYEGSSQASSLSENSAAGSIVSSYQDSLTPSERSALRAARERGRFIPATPEGGRYILPGSSVSSMDSDYETYLREGDDVVGPLRPSQFRPIPSSAPNDPYSVSAGSASQRFSGSVSFGSSSRLSDSSGRSSGSDWLSGSSRSTSFGRADVESLAAAGAGPSTGGQQRQLWEFLQEDF